MTHDELQEEVLDDAHRLSWHHLHMRRSRGRHGWTTASNVPGFPDALLWHRRHGFAAFEFKVPPDKVRPDQLDVLEQLAEAGAVTAVITPADLVLAGSILAGNYSFGRHRPLKPLTPRDL